MRHEAKKACQLISFHLTALARIIVYLRDRKEILKRGKSCGPTSQDSGILLHNTVCCEATYTAAHRMRARLLRLEGPSIATTPAFMEHVDITDRIGIVSIPVRRSPFPAGASLQTPANVSRLRQSSETAEEERAYQFKPCAKDSGTSRIPKTYTVTNTRQRKLLPPDFPPTLPQLFSVNTATR
jgi:hypothetical protein